MGERIETLKEEITIYLWAAGFYPVYVIVGCAALGFYAGVETTTLTRSSGVGLGIAGGCVVWFIGRRHVGTWYDEVVNGFEEDVTNQVRDILGYGGETETFTLRHGSGATWFLVPDRKYELTTLLVGEASVAVHDDAKIKMPWLEVSIGKNTREFYFDQIVSVEYDDPALEMKVSDGELVQYRSTTKPNDALYTIQDRLREFKT